MSKNQVIIIGAGVSGLSAAAELVKNGINNIIILEGQNRLGGRVFSTPLGYQNRIVEMGAQWIHGEKGNPVFELCKSLDMVDKNTKAEFGDLNYYTQDGQKIANEDVDQVFEKLDDIFESVEQYAEKLDENEKKDESLGSLLDTKFEIFLKDLAKKNSFSKEKIEILRAIYQARLSEEKVDTACGNLNELSAMGWNEYIDCPGDDMVNLKNGYGELIQYFCTKIPQDRIFINEVVTQIAWPSKSVPDLANHIVTVTTYNPATQKETVHYGYQCICTISLGCLKQNHKSIFEPALPNYKITAIERLGFGTVNKVFLIYEQPVPIAKDELQGLQILWRDDLEFNLNSIKKWKLKNENFYKSFTSFEILPNSPNILFTFITGESAKYIEDLEDQCLIDVLNEMFSKCFPKIIFPNPKKLVKTRWHSNDFTNGSYSYIPMGSSVEDVKAIASSLNGKVHFAGEHTYYKFQGALHGAYASGMRAAASCIKASKPN